MSFKNYVRQGAQLKTWRKQAGLSAEELAAKLQALGVPMQAYSVVNVEAGTSTLYASTWPQYLTALGRQYESPPEYFALKNGEPKARYRKPEHVPAIPQAIAPGEFPELENAAKIKTKNAEAKAKLKKRLDEIRTEYNKATSKFNAEYLRAIEAHQARRLEQCAVFWEAKEKAEAEANAEFEKETLNGIL